VSFLDTLIYGYRTAFAAGVERTRRNQIDFLAPLTAVDNPTTGRTDVGVAARPTVAIAALSIDWSLGDVFSKTLAAGANTFTFANTSDGQTIVVRVTGAASTLVWPTVKWAGGTIPTQTASGIDVYTFVKVGSVFFGSVVQAMA